MTQASDHIKDAICDSGTPKAECGFCQRTHYNNGSNMDEGEYDQLERLRASFPEGYVQHTDADGISIGEIEGRIYVWNCGCKESEERLARIEGFLWGHQRIISTYYRKRIKAMKDEAAIRETMVTEP